MAIQELESGQRDDDPSSSTRHSGTRRKGGWRAVKYILANETFEKLASMSLIANITLYLRTQYNMDGMFLINVVNIWSGSSNILTLGGAVLSDTYVGRFYTLLIGSIASMVGMGTMTLGAAVSQLRPPSCGQETPDTHCTPSKPWQLLILFVALLLLALGSGCIRPCNISFGADQFDTRTEKGRSQLSRFYNWWYFSFTISLLVALTIVVYVQTNISWALGFAIPTVCFVLSIIFFLLGCRTYIYKIPQGSIFVDIAKVVVAACKKRKENLDSYDNRSFYDPPISESDSTVSKLNRSNRLKFFDKAAVISDPSEVNGEGNPVNNWRLCSVQQVEQLKSIIGILPVWLAGILCFVPMDQQNTFGILQALQTNRMVGSHFVIPPAWIGFASMVALSIWILIYERILLPLRKTWKKKEDVRLSLQTRIKIGIIMSILCMCTGAIVEHKRRETALKAGTFVAPFSVGFLVPQLVLSGLIEAFSAVAIMEFLSSQMPEHMRSLGGSLFFISLSLASYFSTAIANIIYKVTLRHDGIAWLGGHDLNKNKLDYFYAILACIGVFNFFYFSFYGSKFVLVRNEETEDTLNLGKCYCENVIT